MKKTLLAAIVILFAGIVLVQSDVPESLLLFLLVGVVPGTSFVLPPSAMLMLVFAIFWVAFFRFVIMRFFIVRSKRRDAVRRAEHKKRMPTRRFKNQVESAV